MNKQTKIKPRKTHPKLISRNATLKPMHTSLKFGDWEREEWAGVPFLTPTSFPT